MVERTLWIFDTARLACLSGLAASVLGKGEKLLGASLSVLALLPVRLTASRTPFSLDEAKVNLSSLSGISKNEAVALIVNLKLLDTD